MAGSVTARDAAIALAFRRLATVAVDDPHALTTDFLGDCVELFGVAAVGLMLADREGRLRVLASSSEELHTLELFEIQTGEGPCLESYESGATIAVEDPDEQADRWPSVAQRCRQLGLGAAYAVPVRHDQEVMGALNLFCPPGATLTGGDLVIAEALMTTLASRVVDSRRRDAAESLSEHLQIALASRVSIEQAKGILAATLGVGLQDAFNLLRGHARSHGLSLAGIAQEVAAGKLDPHDLSGETLRPAPQRAPDTGGLVR